MTAGTAALRRPDPSSDAAVPDALLWNDMQTLDGIKKAFQDRWRAEGIQKSFDLPGDFLSQTPDEQVFLLVNLEREATGLPPYRLTTGRLRVMTSTLAAEGQPNHDTFDRRFEAAGLAGVKVGEGVAYTANAAAAVFGLMYSDKSSAWGHRRALIDPDYVYVAVAQGQGAPQFTGQSWEPMFIYGLNFADKSYQGNSSGETGANTPSPAPNSSGAAGTTGSSTSRSGGSGSTPNPPSRPSTPPTGADPVGGAPGSGSGGSSDTGARVPAPGKQPSAPGSSSGTSGEVRSTPSADSATRVSTGGTPESARTPSPAASGSGARTAPTSSGSTSEDRFRIPPSSSGSTSAGMRIVPPEQPKPQRIPPAEEHRDPAPSQGYRILPAEQPHPVRVAQPERPKPQRILPEEHHDPAPPKGYRIPPAEQAHPVRVAQPERPTPQRVPMEEHHDPAPSPVTGTRIAPPEQPQPVRVPQPERPTPQRILPEEHHDPAPSQGFRVAPSEQPKPQRVPMEEHHDSVSSTGTRIAPTEQPKPQRIPMEEPTRQRILPTDPHASSGTGARVTPAGTGGGGRVEKVDAPLRDLGATPTPAQITKAFQAQWDTRYPGRTFELPRDFEHRTPQDQMVTLVNLERGAAGLPLMQISAGPLANAAQDRATRGVPTLGRQYLDGLAGHYRASVGVAAASPAVAIYRWMYLSPHDQRSKQAIMDKELTWAGVGVGKTQGGSPFITVDLARGSYDDTRTMPAAPTAALHQPGPGHWHTAPTQQTSPRYQPVAAPVGFRSAPTKTGMRPVVKGAIAVGVVGAAIVGAIALVTGTSVLGGTPSPTAPSSVSNVVSPALPQSGIPLPGAVRPGTGTVPQRDQQSGRVPAGSVPAQSGGNGATGNGATGNGGTGGGAAPAGDAVGGSEPGSGDVESGEQNQVGGAPEGAEENPNPVRPPERPAG